MTATASPWQVATAAALSRLAVITISYLTTLVVPQYDTSAISHPLRGLVTWDSVFFTSIARNGYDFEQSMAFFPFLPAILHASCNAIGWVMGFTSPDQYSYLYPYVGVIFCNICFVLAACMLYHYSAAVLGQSHLVGKNECQSLAWSTTMLFCINPASIHMSAVYTESPYWLLQLVGLNSASKQRYWAATVAFTLSAGFRANGILSAGAVCCAYLLSLLSNSWFEGFIVHAFLRSVICRRLSRATVVTFVVSMFQIALIATPFAVFQHMGSVWYCTNEARPWCTGAPYPWIQREYWDVGFLRYYRIAQLPNFILATPVLLLVCVALAETGKRLPQDLFSLGISSQTHHLDAHIIAQAYHLAALAILGLTTAHVQITTRILFSSSPLLLWAMALFARRSTYHSQAILMYCLTYTLVGTLLFSSFLPWT